MSTFGSPNIINSGLVLYLDAANTKSYSGSSTTWIDLTNNKNSSLINSPTFSSLNNGSIVFDGTNDHGIISIITAHSITIFTICAWVKFTLSGSTYQQGIISKANLNGTEYGWILRKGHSPSLSGANNSKFYFSTGNGSYTRYDTSTYSNLEYTDSNWHYVVGTTSTNNYIYVDGILQTAYKTNKSLDITTSAQPIAIASCYGDLPTNSTYQTLFNGNIGIIKMYNRVLSDAEILQNYNATKKRYGL